MILRGLWERRTLSLIVLIIAIIPVASAAVGPIYAAASRTTVVREVLRAAPAEARGWRYTTYGDVGAGVARFTRGIDFLHPPIYGIETQGLLPAEDMNIPLIWQEGQCAHLKMLEGRCPQAPLEVIVSAAFGEKMGEKVTFANIVTEIGGRPAELTVVGVYRPVSHGDPFWFGRGMFTTVEGATGDQRRAEPFFVTRETRSAVTLAGSSRNWTNYAILGIDLAKVEGEDLETIAAMQASAVALGRQTQAAVFSRVDDVIKVMRAQASTLSVPTYVVIGQLVALAWLLLFQTVGDLVKARSQEIALARLRGHSLARVWRFALTEPLLLLAIAFPLGLLAGRGAADLMIGALLPGVPLTVPATAPLAGAAALAGGLVAALASAWRTARRPVTEEWRRTPRRARPGWVIDAVVLALVGLGLVELLTAGVISDASGQRAGALAVPALLALALALLARRLLPVLVRAFFGLTRRRGGLGAFLALRQVARGTVTAGSTVILATAFGLATFAVCAWTATTGNYAETARFHLGAPSVIEVTPVRPHELAEAVKAADPTALVAAPVVRVSGSVQMVATDPIRFTSVATWDPELAAGRQIADATGAIRAPAMPRAWLTGDRVRFTVSHPGLGQDMAVRLMMTVSVPNRIGPIVLPVAHLTGRSSVREWNLPPACRTERCELRALRGELDYLSIVEPAPEPTSEVFPVTVAKLEIRQGGAWREVDAGLTSGNRWTGEGQATEDGLRVDVSDFTNSSIRMATFPEELPAIVTGVPGRSPVPGLDGLNTVGVKAEVPTWAAPGLTGTGAIVDLEYADRIAYGLHSRARFEVWVSEGQAARIAEALTAQGMGVVSVTHLADLQARFAGEGPGLALLLLLVSALAAAVLALGRTVLALYSSARRRRYELAALAASGAGLRSLRAALLVEQLITVGAGMLTGLGAGMLAARVALERIPQFAEPPTTPPMPFEIAPGPVALLVGGGVLVSVVAAVVVSEVLLRGIQVDRLREAQA
ncbi:FtsX-like permease family protein [Nonomuraea sp. NPDC050663]|uniref:FtsX-like permease family protein n=1 Tax=Nonomuraea sp. NPDC050663 TaxID=3364370 RepID=UPI003799E487